MQASYYCQRTIVVIGHLSVAIMPLVAGQMVTNQGLKLRRILARLFNTLVSGSNETEVKAMKDFIRLIKKHPLEVKLFSKISSGTSLVPAVLMLSVNYLIVLLQFNHVI
ncbi:uncharacterized protein LOC111351671 [Spodoptera litura]|uniref:Uncharacterized protein LOC111351671 n=1 Tax=Spodoptera litura TaxID=69820 RepID=A0A9J7DZ48_SPOLT|nr:uncharacterized protein LOC111351671 [Spodoptera litura]